MAGNEPGLALEGSESLRPPDPSDNGRRFTVAFIGGRGVGAPYSGIERYYEEIVTKKLPKQTNPTGEVIHNNGVMYFLVHHDHAPAIYASLRQVVIHMHETAQFIASKEQELMRMGNISKALAQWITGDEYRGILQTLEEINDDSKATTEVLQHAQNGVIRDIKKASDRQQRIQQHVLNQESLLKGLKDLLRATDGEDGK